MLLTAFRQLWAERREPDPPRRVGRDWVLVGVVVTLVLLEGALADELVWRPVAVPLHLVPAFALLWRRTHPLPAVAAAWSVVAGLDIAAVLAGRDSPGLGAMVLLIVFPYALFRWGSGREAVAGLAIMSVGQVMNLLFFPADVAALDAAGWAFLTVPSALGAAVRFRERAQERAVTEAKLAERTQLARELHDTVAHHVSAIAIQAQAGATLAASDPDASVRALRTIKAEASQTLAEMRTIVGVLREGEDPTSTQTRLADLEQLTEDGHRPAVELEVSGDLDTVPPSIQTAAFRIAQESVTNARRHARRATQIVVRVEGREQDLRVTVTDDGDASYVDPSSGGGFGLTGMRERATLHGGSLTAGPNRGRGWAVQAVLPRQGRS